MLQKVNPDDREFHGGQQEAPNKTAAAKNQKLSPITPARNAGTIRSGEARARWEI
jgi:hypothetical protein